MADMEEDISEVQVVDEVQVGSLSQQGWRLIKVVSSQGVETLSKNYPYQTSPGSYPSLCPYSEQAVIQRSKFVMGRKGIALNDALQAKFEQALRSLTEERAFHEKTKAELLEFKKDRDEKRGEVVKLTLELKELQERYKTSNSLHGRLLLDFENLKKATLNTLVMLPGGNEVSIDDAGKMLRTSEILEGKA